MKAIGGLLSAAAFGLLLTAGPAAALAGDDPVGRISDLHVRPGQVQFVFAVDQLAASDKLVPESVQVAVDGERLDADATVEASASASATNLPERQAMLVIDTSGSMEGAGIAAARAAALQYTDVLAADVKLGLVTFADRPHLLVGPTTDREAVATAIGTVTAAGDTALYDAIALAVQAMDATGPHAEKRLVILSDGDDTNSTRSITDAIGALNRDSVAADVVAFRLSGNRPALDELAAGSHGRVLPAPAAGDLATAFAVAAEAFQQQALVTVDVPEHFSGRAVSMSVSITAGSQRVTAAVPVTMPTAGTALPAGDPGAGDEPDKGNSATVLFLVLAAAFVGLMALVGPAVVGLMMRDERARKHRRLAEVGRYRVVESFESLDHAVTPQATELSEGSMARATLSAVDRAMRAHGARQRVVEQLERAGMRVRPEEWAVLQVCAIAVGGAIPTILFTSIPAFLVGGVAGWLACWLYLRARIARRVAQFEQQLPDMLQLMAGSLRSGFSLNQAIAGVVAEGTEPTASEFARALTEVRLGSDLEDAVERVADRMNCLDLHLVVMAVRISREVGGNLAEVLMTTVNTMRERVQLKMQVRVLSAEGRLSAKILIGLPFAMAAYLLVFKKGYLDPLFQTGRGFVLIIIGLCLLGLGSLWLSRLVRIEV